MSDTRQLYEELDLKWASLREMKAKKIEAIIFDYYKHNATRISNLRPLEIGCAWGTLVDRLAAAAKDVTGLDIDLPALSARKRGICDHTNYVGADAENLRLEQKASTLSS